jgi:SAM-dependent methyltransferase
MTVNWIDTADLSFNNLLLLERVQISWLESLSAENLPAMAAALKANPVVSWYLQHKCPSIAPWLDKVNSIDIHENDPESIWKAEQQIMKAINDWLVYVVDPHVYDAQPFLKWDDQELTSLIDFQDKIVLDIGSGTGRLALLAAPNAYAVYPVEPVANLRLYIKEKAKISGFDNIYPVDGLITDIPFHDRFADITMGGHVFGENPQHELLELERVTKSGGVVILCPGNNDVDNQAHHLLIVHGYSWSCFEEPQDGWKRKYWKTI